MEYSKIIAVLLNVYTCDEDEPLLYICEDGTIIPNSETWHDSLSLEIKELSRAITFIIQKIGVSAFWEYARYSPFGYVIAPYTGE